MSTSDHVVFIVDDKPQVREAVGELLESVGINAVERASVGE